ncbi:hypothetical protein RvY_05754 [Ramazzottius varieornatus]|uniref:Uncharacterized protein n=1 Tax=Ramazzottius varieornatus TaxID=947166 RepID=A0A1D1V5V8_RAMVA|nr:hypothetical protein RvY_05754 [Ramazzottius varieornatus]
MGTYRFPVVPEHTSMQKPADSTATTVIPSPTHAAGEEMRTFDGAAPSVTHLPKSPSPEIPAHVSSEEPRRIPSRASGVKEPFGGSRATSTTPTSPTTPSTPPTMEQPNPLPPFQRDTSAAGAPANNPTQVTEPPGPGTANLVPVEELPTVAPSQLDETGNEANAQAGVGMVPIEENPNVENPVFTPADQAATGAVGEISIPGVHELGPGSDQGVAHVLEPAALPDANADQAASPPAESTP